MNLNGLSFESFLDDKGVMVVGWDFFALNYGVGYGKGLNKGKRKIGISGNRISYVAQACELDFPKVVNFYGRGPNMRLYEASEVESCLVHQEDLVMDCFIDMLKGGGWRFPR